MVSGLGSRNFHLGAAIVADLVLEGRINAREEELDEVLVFDLLWIISHRDDLRVPGHASADQLVDGVLGLTLGIACVVGFRV
jgi:hypothetical protein